MADQVLTKQKLINADEDLGDLEEVLNGPPGKLIKTRLGREVYTLASVPQINTMTREEISAAVAPKANKIYVDIALSNLSTTAKKFYPTLAEANYYSTTMAVNDVVTIGEEANKGLWYKATAGATTLTKSPYDPLTQAKSYTDAASTTTLSESKDYTDTQKSDTLMEAQDIADESIAKVILKATANDISHGFIDSEGRLLGSFDSKGEFDFLPNRRHKE